MIKSWFLTWYVHYILVLFILTIKRAFKVDTLFVVINHHFRPKTIKRAFKVLQKRNGIERSVMELIPYNTIHWAKFPFPPIWGLSNKMKYINNTMTTLPLLFLFHELLLLHPLILFNVYFFLPCPYAFLSFYSAFLLSSCLSQAFLLVFTRIKSMKFKLPNRNTTIVNYAGIMHRTIIFNSNWSVLYIFGYLWLLWACIEIEDLWIKVLC